MQVKVNLSKHLVEELDRIWIEKKWMGYESRAEALKSAIREWVRTHRQG